MAARGEAGDLRLSLSSNPDVTFEVVEKYAEQGMPLIKIGVVNQQMPFMPGGAVVGPDFFDLVVTDPAATHAVFAPPNNKVSAADYAIGLHASSPSPTVEPCKSALARWGRDCAGTDRARPARRRVPPDPGQPQPRRHRRP